MRIVITGAGGFLGGILAGRLLSAWPDRGHRVVLVDRGFASSPSDPRVVVVTADLAQPPVLREVLADSDVVFHLASIPGGAAEQDYDASRRVNLELSLHLLEALAAHAAPPRVIYASSIAIFGAPLPPQVDDETAARPAMTYGAHKLMVETAFANLVRLGRLTGLAVRLPGILARPGGGPGLKSAFMSELFHGAVARRRVQLPVSANATLWVMSAACAADNLIHAAEMRIPADAAPALTLPVLRVTLGELVAAVVRRTGVDPGLFSFKPDAALEAQFGSLPPMTARAGSRLGFKHDGSLDRLVDRALCAAGYAGFEDATAP